MVLLAAVAAASMTVAGGVALLDPSPAPPLAASPPAFLADATVRIVGAPFVPNTDPHRR